MGHIVLQITPSLASLLIKSVALGVWMFHPWDLLLLELTDFTD